MERATMIRDGRTIELYVVIPEGWLSAEVRRDSHGRTFTERRCANRESAREALLEEVAEFRRAGWTMVTSS